MKKFIAFAALIGAALTQEMFTNFDENDLQEVTDETDQEPLRSNGYSPFNYPVHVPREYQANVDKAIAKYPGMASKLKKVRGMGGATWIDSISAISKVEPILKAVNGKKEVAMFVISNMPNKGCNSPYSFPEITCADSACTDGLKKYKTEFVDKLAALFKKYPNTYVALILEPNVMGHLVTSMDIKKCKQSETAYNEGIKYLLTSFRSIYSLFTYLDIGHSGWLGNQSDLYQLVMIAQKLVYNSGGPSVIRGFATNTGNYNELGCVFCEHDACGLKAKGISLIDEIKYGKKFDKFLKQFGLMDMVYIIDTSRSGVPSARKNCANTCNIKNAGIGLEPGWPNIYQLSWPKIDSNVWSRIPGYSDGKSTTGGKYDPMCSSVDAKTPAPARDVWNEDFFISLVKNSPYL